MRRFIVGVVMGFLLATGLAWASHTPSPPPSIKDRDTLLYLRKLHQSLHNIEITTTDPNGSRRGMNGDVIIFNDSGTYRWRVNVSTTPEGGTTWSSVTS